MRVRRSATALLAASLAVLGVAGCGDREPSAAPSVSPTVSVKPSPTGPVAPVLPADAKREDDVGAKAFIRFYFAALTHAMQTGDASVMTEYASADCEACAGIGRRVRKIREAGGRTQGGGWTIESMQRSGQWTTEMPAFLVVFREEAKSLWGNDGRLIDRDKATKSAVIVWLVHGTSTWRLRELNSIPEAKP